MTYAIKPGPKALAATFMLAGWSNNTFQPAVTDACGVKWAKPSTLQVALAVCGAESSGDVLAFRVDYPGSAQESTDYGLMEINDHANGEFFDGPSFAIKAEDSSVSWNWAVPVDNAWAAHQIFLKAGRSWHPWNAYTGGGWLRDRFAGKSWMDWANYGITQCVAAQKAGASLDEIASVFNNDPLEYN